MSGAGQQRRDPHGHGSAAQQYGSHLADAGLIGRAAAEPGCGRGGGIQMLDWLASPMMTSIHLRIAAAVKLTSPGPVLYQQKRPSWNRKDIWI